MALLGFGRRLDVATSVPANDASLGFRSSFHFGHDVDFFVQQMALRRFNRKRRSIEGSVR